MLICEQIYEEERQLRERQVEGGDKEKEEVEIENSLEDRSQKQT